jgi:hypothetical protein
MASCLLLALFLSSRLLPYTPQQSSRPPRKPIFFAWRYNSSGIGFRPWMRLYGFHLSKEVLRTIWSDPQKRGVTIS